MASESLNKLSPLPYPLHFDRRETNPFSPLFLEVPGRAESTASTSTSPLDGHLVAHPLHLDLYNPMAPSNNQKPRQSESNTTSKSVGEAEKRGRVSRQQQHLKQSSTASLAEFLKSTGPEDIRRESVSGTVRSESPANKKKNPGSFLLKFAAGKSATTTKRDELPDISSLTKTSDASVPPLAHPQVTAAGRKYYAIKVDYPYADDSSMSSRPLLAETPIDPKTDTRSEMDYHAVMAMKKHHRISSVLGSDTSMEFLNDRNNNTRSSTRYSSYPLSQNRNSLARSSSMSDMLSRIESFHDDGSILPTDSVSLRPAQVTRTLVNNSQVNRSVTTSPPRALGKPLETGRRSRSSSYETPAQDGGAGPALAASPILPPSQTSSGTLELMESIDMLDKLCKSKSVSDSSSITSHTTTKSLQQRRRVRRIGQQSASLDSTHREATKRPIHTSRSIPNLINKGLPLLPPHMNNNTNPVQRERAATIAAALSARSKVSPEPKSPVSSRAFSPPPFSSSSVSLENYAIPEDDVLSLKSGKSGISSYRNQRRERVRDKRQKDLDEERSRKLHEAMKLLQKDVQMKEEAHDRDEHLETGSSGSQTPRQMPSIEKLRNSPITPPPTGPIHLYAISPVSVVVDCPPSGPRRRPTSSKPQPNSLERSRSNSDSRPKTSNSGRTIFTNGRITPASSPPSSPTRSQYQNLVKQPIPQLVSLPPNYPPPKPTPTVAGRTVGATPLSPPPDEDRELRIAALEEQKWVLEQALRVLLNQQPGNTTPSTSPHLGYLERSPSKSVASLER
jgi:hypothetical protein